MDIIKAIIVDDEKIARDYIKECLGNDKDVKIVAECDNGVDAAKMISDKNPDLVFLDIQMPLMNGFEVIESFGGENLPFVIFITAFDQYAIKAFEANAIDYLLKPFDKKRFDKSLLKAKQQISERKYNIETAAFLQKLIPANSYPKRILIKSEGRSLLITAAKISHIEAFGDYLKIYSDGNWYTTRRTMNDIQNSLHPDDFVRIHKSFIVNLEFINEIQPYDNNSHIIVLSDGSKLKLSRNYKEYFFDKFKSADR